MTPEQIAAGASCYQCLNEDQKRAAVLYLLDRATTSQSYTVSQLNALTAAQAQALGFAYASDALDMTRVYGSTGVMCYWSGTQWLTVGGSFPPATTFHQLAINIFRVGFSASSGSTGPMTTLNQISLTQGTGAANGSQLLTVTGAPGVISTTSTGTTSTGTVCVRGYQQTPVTTSGLCRALAFVNNHYTSDQSAVGDTFQIRCGIETYSSSIVATTVADMFDFIYDENNILGLGATGSNYYILSRSNSSTLSFASSGIAYNASHWQCVTVVPVSPTTATVTIAYAPDGGTATVLYSATVTLSAATLSPIRMIAKATGTNAKTFTNFAGPRQVAWRMNSNDPTPFVF